MPMTAFGPRSVKRTSPAKTVDNPIVTRFAPSPNGRLHVGHAYAAIQAHDFARSRDGRFLLRIEDIDCARARPEHVAAIIDDVAWLGASWDGPVILQSLRLASYATGFARISAQGLAYRCFCSRSDIAAALATGPVRHGPDGPVYPGTCRWLTAGEAAARAQREPHSWRLDMAAALATVAGRHHVLGWNELSQGFIVADPGAFGDVVLIRRDVPASYHLAATLDDAADAVSHVVRGADLFAYTAVHRLLQVLLDLPEPVYHHHLLLIDETGQKLAKSRDSASLGAMRAAGVDGRQLAASLRAGRFPTGISVGEP